MKRHFQKLIAVCFTLALLLIGTSRVQAQYCTLSANNSTYEWIEQVEFAGIENASTANGYSDFTDQLGVVVPGVSYEFTGTMGQDDFGWDAFYTVFIDFNQDGDFEDAGERFDIGSDNCPGGCSVSGDILIPGDAVPGTTRMRVVLQESSYIPTPCGTYFYGETEDYSLLVGGDCTPPDFAYTITDECELFTFDVTATINDMGGDIEGSNSSVTIILTRSDEVSVAPVIVTDLLLGQTIDIITNVPFGVTVTASIEGTDPLCNLDRNWNEEGLCPPLNDECETATVLNCWNWDPIEGSTVGASIAPPGINFCDGLASPSAPAVWYKYTAAEYSIIELDISLDNYDSQFFVYSGVCGDLSCIGGSDNGSISWTAYAGQTFYFMITGWGTSAGDFVFNLECTSFPACDYPTLNTTMVDENGDEIIDCLSAGETYNVEVSFTGGFDTSYLVYVGGTYNEMLPSETHVFGPFNTGSNTNISATPVGYAEFCTLYGIIESELCPAENDLCGDAITVSCGDVIPGTTVNSSTLDVPATCGTAPGTGGGVWYSINGTGGNIVASMCGSTYDTKINVYSGACGALTCVTGIDDFCGLQSEVNWDSEAGVEYLIYVNGFYANVGDFILTITCEDLTVASIDGTVNWNAECGDRDLTVDFYEPGTDVLVASYLGAVNAVGEFTLPDVAIGTFDIIVNIEGYLAVGVESSELAAGSNTVDAGAIIAGDINGDNGINIQDVSFMNAAFGSTSGDANYNPLADANCDGGVNIQDVSTVNAAFGQSGAATPL